MLLKKGYLSDIAEFRNIADFRNTSAALVAQPGRELPLIERKNGKKGSLGGDLDPRPLPSWDMAKGGPLPYQGNALPG